MGQRGLLVLLAAMLGAPSRPALAADTLKIASPIRGSWEGAIPELGKQAGIFQKHGLDLEQSSTPRAAARRCRWSSPARSTSGSARDCSAAWAPTARARPYASSGRAPPDRERSSGGSSPDRRCSPCAMSTASPSPIPTTGASSQLAVLRSSAEYGIKARRRDRRQCGDDHPGDVGPVDVGWAVAPFVLDLLNKGEARMIARRQRHRRHPRPDHPRADHQCAETWRQGRTRSPAT